MVVVGTPQQDDLAERMKITILKSVLDECFKELGCPRFLGEKLWVLQQAWSINSRQHE